MPDDVRISELSPISSIGNNDLMEVSHEDSGAESGYVSTKMTMTQLSNKLNNNIQYVSDLETASKTIIGGINSLLANMTTPYANLSFPIAQGVCCSYNGLVYQANQAIPTSEAWTPAHWTQVVLTDLIGSGGGSGGHTILDNSGTALTQRANLQFKGAYSDDNSGDDTTEVNVVRSMTKAQFNQLSADEKVGIINITDEDVNASEIPISGNDPTDTKTYIDNKVTDLLKAVSNDELEQITPTLTGVTNYAEGSYYFTRGKMVFLHFSLQGLTANSAQTVYQMPTGYRPISPIYAVGRSGASYTGIASVTVQNNGNVSISSVDTYASIDVVYIAV